MEIADTDSIDMERINALMKVEAKELERQRAILDSVILRLAERFRGIWARLLN